MSIGCETLRQILNASAYVTGQEPTPGLGAHVRSCPNCQRGIEQFASAFVVQNVLTCEQCRARFPRYYEATRPEYALVEMAEFEIAEVVLHLGQCANCRGEYEELMLLWELEERDEMV
jgi:hypothetical protein